MKIEDIKIGKLYSNGLGVVKKVVYIHPNHNEWYDSPPVKYEIVKDGTICNFHKGLQGYISLSSFAAWAKFELK